MTVVEKFIIGKRCDIPMRRSKEKCKTLNGDHWKCHGNCDGCFCAIYKYSDGTESHSYLKND